MDGQFKLMVMALMGNKEEAVVLLEYKMAKSVIGRKAYKEKA